MIDTNEKLKAVVTKIRQTGYVAIDTEFVWTRTYYPQLGIIQIGTSDANCFLVDVLSVDNLSPLADILSDPAITKIFHDAKQDLVILRRYTGAQPCTIFDTRLAAGFAGLSSTTSLDDLAREIFSVILVKSERRTNWLKRPLTSAQCEYALNDIRYLPAIRDALLERIGNSDRLAWLNDELREYDNQDMYADIDPYSRYRRIKSASRLDQDDLVVLRALVYWRERKAQNRDRPRGWIVSDNALVDLTRKKPETISGLSSISDLSEGKIQRYGHQLIRAIQDGLREAEQDDFEQLERLYPKPIKNKFTRTVMDTVAAKSKRCGIDSALVASATEIRSIFNNRSTIDSDDHRLLRGWRREFLGEDIVSMITNMSE